MGFSRLSRFPPKSAAARVTAWLAGRGRDEAAVLAQPSGFRPEMPDLFYQNNIKGWGPASCDRQTPILVLPGDLLAHPYAVAVEAVRLASNAQVSLYPWKDSKDRIPLAVRHVRTFPRAYQPATAAR
jgi:hypothetical protein